MTKLQLRWFKLTGKNGLEKPRPSNLIFNISSSQSKEIGSSMIELLLAVFLALIATSSAAQIMSKLYDSGLNRRAAATSAIEVAISNDLAWFRQYAVLWQLETGPYKTLPKDVTQTDTDYEQIPSPNTSNLSNKYKVPPGCSTSALANAFQKDAAKLKTDFDAIKKPPFDIPNGASTTTLDLPKSASGYNLERRIQPNDNLPGTLTITYTLTNPAFDVPQIFERSSSVYLPAAGWCS